MHSSLHIVHCVDRIDQTSKEKTFYCWHYSYTSLCALLTLLILLFPFPLPIYILFFISFGLYRWYRFHLHQIYVLFHSSKFFFYEEKAITNTFFLPLNVIFFSSFAVTCVPAQMCIWVAYILQGGLSFFLILNKNPKKTRLNWKKKKKKTFQSNNLYDFVINSTNSSFFPCLFALLIRYLFICLAVVSQMVNVYYLITIFFPSSVLVWRRYQKNSHRSAKNAFQYTESLIKTLKNDAASIYLCIAFSLSYSFRFVFLFV